MTNEELEKFTNLAGTILIKYRSTEDYYRGTVYEGFMNYSPVVRGTIGEQIVSIDMESRGHVVAERTSTGHDRVIDGIKTEIKHGMQGKFDNDSHIINHISADKDWERLVFYGINRPFSEIRRIWFTKEDFIANIDSGIFRRQQGGNSLQNDDFMVANTKALLTQPWVRDITSF